MTEQYYYMALYILRQLGQVIVTYWWRYVDIVHTYSVTAIATMLVGILILMIYGIRRNGVVTVVVGEELHNLIRAMRGEDAD